MVNSPSEFFILSAFVLHELRWASTLQAIVAFRKNLRQLYGLKLREEIHSRQFIFKPGALMRLQRHIRLLILRQIIDFEATIPDVNVINILIDKRGKPNTYNVFDAAWSTLVQRIHNTISNRNFPGPQNAQDHAMLIVDQTDAKKLQNLTRRVRLYNPVPSAFTQGSYFQIPITTLIEDASHRNSVHSYFLQLCDVNAYFLLQKQKPCLFVKKKAAEKYFDRLDPILCKVASNTDPQGVVRL